MRSSLLPFLYQTRTITRSLPRLNRTPAYTTSAPPHPDRNQNPENESKPRKSFLQQRAEGVLRQRQRPSAAKPVSSDSMTQGEKQTFGDLLERFGISKHRGEGPSRDGEWNLSDHDRREMAQISEIFDSVYNEAVQDRQNQTADQKSDTSRARREERPQQDFRILEHLHRMDYTTEELSELLDQEKISTDQAVSYVVRREWKQTQRILQSAVDRGVGDTEIWEICQDRIFSIVRRLEDDGAPVQGAPETTAGDFPEEAFSAPDETGPPVLDVPANVPIETVVVKLYPRMLLIAFRILNLHYPNSPFIGHFREAVKSHGRASSILGGSTDLYNEMIYFYWRGCRDLPGVLGLLEEMAVTGVEPDRRTCGLINTIVHEHDRVMRAEAQLGTEGKNLYWKMAPNQRVLRELTGHEGWLERLTQRVTDLEERQKGR